MSGTRPGCRLFALDPAGDALDQSRKPGSKGKVNDVHVKDAALIGLLCLSITLNTFYISSLWCILSAQRGVSMKAITLRSLPPHLAKAIRKEAARKGLSINKTVIILLEGRTAIREGKKGRCRASRELDILAGSWSKKEAAEFDKAPAAQRTIDPDLCVDSFVAGLRN